MMMMIIPEDIREIAKRIHTQNNGDDNYSNDDEHVDALALAQFICDYGYGAHPEIIELVQPPGSLVHNIGFFSYIRSVWNTQPSVALEMLLAYEDLPAWAARAVLCGRYKVGENDTVIFTRKQVLEDSRFVDSAAEAGSAGIGRVPEDKVPETAAERSARRRGE